MRQYLTLYHLLLRQLFLQKSPQYPSQLLPVETANATTTTTIATTVKIEATPFASAVLTEKLYNNTTKIRKEIRNLFE